MIRRILLSTLATLGLAAVASAQPQPNLQVIAPEDIELRVISTTGEDVPPGCFRVYDNKNGSPGNVRPNGFWLGDDLHTTATGDWPLCAVNIGYYLAGTAGTDIYVQLFRSDASDGAPLVALTPMFTILGGPGGGAFEIHAHAPFGIVAPHTWMMVSFSNLEAGLLLTDPPQTGTSHNVDFYNGVRSDPFASFGIPANYYLSADASPPTGTQNATWGAVKAIYR